MTPVSILVALGFGAYRLTQLAVYDEIADRPRDWASRQSDFVRRLLRCPYCAGFWCSLGVLAVWWAAGHWAHEAVLAHGIEVWVVSGVQALLSQADNWLAQMNVSVEDE